MPGPRYRAEPHGRRRITDIEGLTLVFHRPSGITHILSTPVPEILAELEDGHADAGGIAARLAAQHDIADIAEAEAVIGARLAELAALGLVEQL